VFISSFILGIIGLGVFISLTNSLSINEKSIENARELLSIPTMLLVYTMEVIIPIYIFVLIVNIFINNEFSTKTNIISILSLVSISIIGIAIGLLMLPLILLIPENLKNIDYGDSEALNINKIV
jgi:Na+/serine symporter